MRKIKVLSFLLLTLALSLSSCKKDKYKVTEGKKGGSSLLKKSYTGIYTPRNNNGILEFGSREELLGYYEYLESVVNSAYDKEQDVDSLLNAIEAELSFESYRKYLIQEYDWKDKEFDSEGIEELSNIDFVIDEVRKSILNRYKEIIIGDSCFVYFSENQIYRFHVNDMSSVYKLRLIKGSDDVIPSGDVLGGNFDLISVKIKMFRIEEIRLIQEEYENYGGNTYYNNIDCNIYDKEIGGSFTRMYYNTADSTYITELYACDLITVDFGDGTSENFVGVANFSTIHTYPSTGTYTVTVTYTYRDMDNNIGVLIETLTINVNGACSQANKSIRNTQNDNTWKLETKGWVKHDIFGKHLGGYTHSWKKINGKWKRKKADLFCRIEGAFRDNDCNIVESVARSKAKRTKKLRAVKHKLFKNYDINTNDCISSHSFGGGAWYMQNIINPCQ